MINKILLWINNNNYNNKYKNNINTYILVINKNL